MKKLLIIFICILVMNIYSFAEAPVSMESLSRPSFIIAKYDRIYILEKTTVYIYSIKDFKLLKKFGKEGEGPGEIRYVANDRPMNMLFQNGDIVINSQNKISFFSKDGEYKKEIKLPIGSLLVPLNKNRHYLGSGPIIGENKKSYIGFRLFDQNFKGKKVLYKTDFEVRNPGEILLPVMAWTYNPVYKDKIFINSGTSEFLINIFDHSGKNIASIKKNSERITIGKDYRRDTMTFFKTDHRFKSSYEYVKKRIKFRTHFPVIKDVKVVDDIIFVITYKKKEDLSECILLDLKGNEKKRLYIPLNDLEPLSFYPLFYTVLNGKIYTMVEDEEDEVWKIHITNLNL